MVEELLAIMADNEDEPPKELPECINIRYLYEDDQFLYFGKIKSKECPCTKSIVVKVEEGKALEKLPNLKDINGWEFKKQILEDSNWSHLIEDFRKREVSSWEVDTNNHFKIEEEYIIYTLVLRFISKKVVVEKTELKGRFEKTTLKMVE